MKKKAQLQIPGEAPEIWAFPVFLLFVLILVSLFFLKSCSTTGGSDVIVSEAFNSVDTNTILLSYLRIPVGDKSMADFVSAQDYKGLVENSIIFKKLTHRGSYQFMIEITDKCVFNCGTSVEGIFSKSSNAFDCLPEEQQKILVPLDEGGFVELGFCYWEDEGEHSAFTCQIKRGCK